MEHQRKYYMHRNKCGVYAAELANHFLQQGYISIGWGSLATAAFARELEATSVKMPILERKLEEKNYGLEPNRKWLQRFLDLKTGDYVVVPGYGVFSIYTIADDSILAAEEMKLPEGYHLTGHCISNKYEEMVDLGFCRKVKPVLLDVKRFDAPIPLQDRLRMPKMGSELWGLEKYVDDVIKQYAPQNEQKLGVENYSVTERYSKLTSIEEELIKIEAEIKAIVDESEQNFVLIRDDYEFALQNLQKREKKIPERVNEQMKEFIQKQGQLENDYNLQKELFENEKREFEQKQREFEALEAALDMARNELREKREQLTEEEYSALEEERKMHQVNAEVKEEQVEYFRDEQLKPILERKEQLEVLRDQLKPKQDGGWSEGMFDYKTPSKASAESASSTEKNATPLKTKVFISYSRRDYDRVIAVCEKLKTAGIDCWMDQDGIETGDEFKRKIVRAIKATEVFLFFSSEASNQSEWTVKEVDYAVKKKKPIIPIRLDDSEYEESIDFDIAGLDYIDLFTPTVDAAFMSRLIRALKNKQNKTN